MKNTSGHSCEVAMLVNQALKMEQIAVISLKLEFDKDDLMKPLHLLYCLFKDR